MGKLDGLYPAVVVFRSIFTLIAMSFLFPRKRWTRIGWAAGLFLALYLLAMAALAWDGLHDRVGRAEVALVLGGGGIDPDGWPSRRTRSRLDRAIELDREQSIRIFLVSGGNGRGQRDESEIMADYLVAHGIDRSRIALDHGGFTTYDSARAAAAFLKAHQLHGVWIVTQYFHVARARLALERCGVGPVCSVHSSLYGPHDLYSLAREVIAWGYYWVRSYPLPGPV